MKISNLVVVVIALSMTSIDSSAQPVASSGAKVTIPPWPEHEGLPAFDAEPFAEEKTKAPTLEEWTSAPEVSLSRVSLGASACRARRLREWVKIHCDRKTAGLRLLAGSTDGIALWVGEAIPNERDREGFDTMGRFGEIVFPVRRGDRRVFEWFALEFWENYDGPMSVGSSSSMIVEEQWLEGATKPEVALLTR